MVDETSLINVVRTMLFSIVHSSDINNTVATGVNNIDKKDKLFSVVRTTIIMLVNGKNNLNLTPIEIYKLKDNHEDGESDKHNGLLTLLLPMK